MLVAKRSSYASSKSSKYSCKLKEMLCSPHPKLLAPKVPDIKDFSTVPLIKQSENDALLPKYKSSKCFITPFQWATFQTSSVDKSYIY